MIDFVIKFTTHNGLPRFVLETDPMAITEDAIIETAVIVSLFTDRQANDEDIIPDGSNNKRGWWGDSLANVKGDKIGSRLWLLEREKQIEGGKLDIRPRAKFYAEEALEHFIEDGVANSINITSSYPRPEWLGLVIKFEKANGQTLIFNYQYEALNAV